MATNTQTLTVRRVQNGWIVLTDGGAYVATTAADVAALVQRWVQDEEEPIIRYEWPGPPPYRPRTPPPPATGVA
jgi:hypothetical protein